jgi:uncharacterized RmlC-like cupin family protein
MGSDCGYSLVLEWFEQNECEVQLEDDVHVVASRLPGRVFVVDWLIKMPSSKRGLAMDWANHGVKIVHSDELDLNTPQTSGMTRAAAITHASAGANKLWAGTMLVQPDAKTGPHHHGELETVLYVVKGRVRMRWGDQLEFSEEARPGDFIYVPPYVPHQEINASPDQICEAVVVRNGQDPIVVNLDLRTPEPASAGHPGMPFHPDR